MTDAMNKTMLELYELIKRIRAGSTDAECDLEEMVTALRAAAQPSAAVAAGFG